MTVPSSFAFMLPSLSLSKRLKATRNSDNLIYNDCQTLAKSVDTIKGLQALLTKIELFPCL